MPKTRDDLLKEIADGRKVMLICRMIQWLFWLAAVGVAITVSGGFWKWAGVVACAAVGVFAEIFRSAAYDETEKTRAEFDPNTHGTSADAPRFRFTRDLKLGMTGKDVNQLQGYLISHATGSAAEQLARNGATETFGALTQHALIEFQKKAGITPANGSFGPITRAYVNALP
jgi:murein L,D-transpeptidase YcbB/YkuD